MRRLIVVLLVLMSALVPNMTFAAPSDQYQRAQALVEQLQKSNDRDADFSRLAPEDKQHVVDFMQLANVDVHPLSIHRVPNPKGGADPCWQNGQWVGGYNAVGWVVWSYEVDIYWCGDYTTMSYATYWTNVSTPGWWWSYLGDSGWSYGGAGYNGIELWRQGHFQYCPYTYGCIQNKWPWVHEWAYAWGQFYSTWGG